jgi:hypothetical protein
VQVVLQPNHHRGRDVLEGKDFYLWILPQGTWIAVDRTGFLDWLVNSLEAVGVILVGRTLPDEEWHRILNAAIDDPRFLPRSDKGPEPRGRQDF